MELGASAPPTADHVPPTVTSPPVIHQTVSSACSEATLVTFAIF